MHPPEPLAAHDAPTPDTAPQAPQPGETPSPRGKAAQAGESDGTPGETAGAQGETPGAQGRASRARQTGTNKAQGRREKRRRIAGMTVRRFAANVVLPIAGILVIAVTLVFAPSEDRPLILMASLVAMASGLAATSIGVYGGVLVPGLLLLGVDARFAAAASLFLQLLVIPLGVGAHVRLGNVNRGIAMPLILGGMAGAFAGPFFAAALPSDVIARLVAAMIVFVGVIVLATLKWGGLGDVRPLEDVPTARVAGAGGVAGFSSGISGAGWGPIGVKLLILLRIEPKAAIGSSLLGRIFMAGAAVVGYLITATGFEGVEPDYFMVVVLFFGSVITLIPGAFMVSRLGREKATILITLLSISLALPTLIFGVH